MIVPMKKVAVIVQSKDASSALAKLRTLGVLHVEDRRLPSGKETASLQDDLALADEAIAILYKTELEKRSGLKRATGLRDWKFNARHIVDLHNRLMQLEAYSRGVRASIAEWEDWGDFDPAAIEELKKKKIYIKLYRIPVKEIKNMPAQAIVKVVSKSGGIANCAVITRQEIEIPFKELSLPRMGPKEMRLRLAEEGGVMEVVKDSIRKYAIYSEKLTDVKKGLEKELEFFEALGGMRCADTLMYITGYAPYDAAGTILASAKKERWGAAISEPEAEDNVPTLIRNPRWVAIISPLFRVMEIMPGYKELDISLWFLLFFSVFFGMLIGDAGYGIIFFILTVFARHRWGSRFQDKSIFTLFYVLSLCAVAWGALTGTFFGQAWLPQHFKPLAPALRNDRNVQTLCFFLGALHLTVAHLWRAAVKLPSAKALGDIGWAIVLWGGFFLAKTLVMGEAFPEFGKWFFIAGPVLVIFFTSPEKNIVRGVGKGIGNLLLNLVNSFTDVVSYIRLFAVGLATVAIADAFNGMAMGIGFNNILRGLATTAVLLVGHALNIILGPLAVLVHGVRLNVLEFCSHLDIKWSGFPYKPLREGPDIAK